MDQTCQKISADEVCLNRKVLIKQRNDKRVDLGHEKFGISDPILRAPTVVCGVVGGLSLPLTREKPR